MYDKYSHVIAVKVTQKQLDNITARAASMRLSVPVYVRTQALGINPDSRDEDKRATVGINEAYSSNKSLDIDEPFLIGDDD